MNRQELLNHYTPAIMNLTPTTLATVATRCGKPVAILKTIQKSFGLHVPDDGDYSEAYCRFLKKIVALQALHVSRSALVTLFDKERQILRLLHVDSLSTSPTWYLDACVQPETRATLKTRLLLSGYDLGFNLDTTTLQDTLDFGSREKELFSGADMGEYVRKLLADYLRLFSAIRHAVSAELPVIRTATSWASKLLES
jgi:hypothetical protein